jgi:predicted DNA-binding transcriptional regulator YafY
MSDRSHRLFEIIQILRTGTTPITARALATTLDVTARTIYRDIVTLQATGVPIEGAAGLGYVMRNGYDLPPLNFTQEEMEAIAVGLSLIGRTADIGLMSAARQAAGKIRAAVPDAQEPHPAEASLLVSHWSAVPQEGADYGLLRKSIRDERKLLLRYSDGLGRETERIVCPVALIYYVDNAVLAAWCELRRDFRHFRVDRISRCAVEEATFKGQAESLRGAWQATRQPFGAQTGSMNDGLPRGNGPPPAAA